MSQRSRRNFIKRVGVLGGTGGIASIAGCSGIAGLTDGNGEDGNSGNGSQSLIIGSVFASGHVINEMAKSWAETVAEETDDRVSITIEPAFGGEQEVMEQTRIGSIDGTIIGTRWVIDYDPENFWVESPFVFDSWEQQKRAFETEYLDDGRQRLREEGNQRLIGPPIYRGYRHTSGNSAFETPEDVQGTNLRVPSLSPWVNIWEGIGASPTTVAFDELYSALQQGVVDAQENPAQTVLAASLHEVQSHYTLTQHHAATGWFTFNDDTFSSLSEDDKSVVTDTLTQNIEDLSSSIADSESQAIDDLESEGMTIVEPDRDAWLAAAEEPLQTQFENNWEPSLEEVRNI